MKKKVTKVIVNSIFLALSVMALAFSIYLLSWQPTENTFIYYVFTIPFLLVTLLFTVKLVLILKFEFSKTYKIICNTVICAILLFMCIEFFYFNMNGSYKAVAQAENYKYCNSSNFVDYEENETSVYLEDAYITTSDIYNSKSTNVLKRLDIDEKKCVLVIEMTKIDTKSFILKNLKYYILKALYFNDFKDEDISKNGDFICYYYPGMVGSGIVKTNKLIILDKTKDSLIFLNIESTDSSLSIDEAKTLEFFRDMSAQVKSY